MNPPGVTETETIHARASAWNLPVGCDCSYSTRFYEGEKIGRTSPPSRDRPSYREQRTQRTIGPYSARETQPLERHVLADRIVVYCDTVVAFSAVNGFAFLIALGEPDIRCSIAEISSVIGGINLIIPLFCTIALVWLRRMEIGLRDGESQDALVTHFWKIVVPLRIGLVWTFSIFVLAGIYAATFDTTCMASLR